MDTKNKEINKMETEEEFTERVLKGLNPHYEPGWAKSCGLVRGDSEKNGIRYACTRCKICVEMTYEELGEILEARGEKNESIRDPITAKGYVLRKELIVREKFLKAAAKVGCKHLEERIEKNKNPAYKQQLEYDAIIALLKSQEDSNK